MELKKDGKNFWRTTILLCVLIFCVSLVIINSRVARIERTIDERAKIVARFLDLEIRVLELEKKSVEIEKHHQDLLEKINNNESPTNK